MVNRLDLLSQQLFQKEINHCSVEELKQISQQYPFFAPAQFLLVKKLKEEGDPSYPQQLQKAALYHHNLAAYDFLINDQDYQTIFPEEIEPVSIDLQETTFLEEIGEQEENKRELTETEKIEEPAPDEPQQESPGSKPEELPVIETSGFELMEEPIDEVQETSDGLHKEEIPDEVVPEEIPEEDTEHDKNEKDRPEVILQSDLSFEPFHTVDYFASQGIRLSQEEIGKDQFGHQLKSFTEWLKTMKRLPAMQQMKKLDPHAEEKVENIAAHSIDNTEILTEAMAEVWVKQGKLEKAIEVYNKLSLLNPSKRSYFAAKLENLKKAI